MATVTLRAFGGLAFLLAVIGAALFVPAGTLAYWQAWLFLAVFAAAILAITLYLVMRAPALLARRVKAGPLAENASWQKVLQSLASLAFIALFVIGGLDHRGGWSRVPPALSLAGDVVVAAGLLVVFLVFRVNAFTSAIIEVSPEQPVVSSGPYAVVRHPMYAGASLMLLGVPLALGSWWAALALPVMELVIVLRLLDEERLLIADLAGYAEYRRTVTHRLVPRLW